MKTAHIITFLTLAGSIMIFSSWLSDNYLKKHWDKKAQELDLCKTEMQKAIVARDAAELYHALFYDRYLHDSSELYTKDNALDGSYNTGEALVEINNIVIEAEKTSELKHYDEDWYNKRLDTFKLWEDTLKYYYINSKMDSLDDFVEMLPSKMDNMHLKEMYNVQEYVKYSDKQKEYSDRLIFWFYILGSVCLGVAYLLHRRTEN